MYLDRRFGIYVTEGLVSSVKAPFQKLATPAATVPCRLQQHQQTNILEGCEKHRDLHESRHPRLLYAYALKILIETKTNP